MHLGSDGVHDSIATCSSAGPARLGGSGGPVCGGAGCGPRRRRCRRAARQRAGGKGLHACSQRKVAFAAGGARHSSDDHPGIGRDCGFESPGGDSQPRQRTGLPEPARIGKRLRGSPVCLLDGAGSAGALCPVEDRTGRLGDAQPGACRNAEQRAAAGRHDRDPGPHLAARGG